MNTVEPFINKLCKRIEYLNEMDKELSEEYDHENRMRIRSHYSFEFLKNLCTLYTNLKHN